MKINPPEYVEAADVIVRPADGGGTTSEIVRAKDVGDGENLTPVQRALKEGYTQDEINSFINERAQAAKAEGYSDEEIAAYVKENVIQQPEFDKTAIAGPGQANLSIRKQPTSILEALQAGWGWSTTALGAEALKDPGEAKLPEMGIDGDTPWYYRIPGAMATMAGDVPAMVAGGIIGGGSAGPIGAAAGGFAMPMGLRKVFIDAIESGQAVSKKEFADRFAETVWETTKGLIIGGSVGKVGELAGEATKALAPVAQKSLNLTAELATLTEVSARIEGEAPDPQSLVDNAVILGVAKTVLPNWQRPTIPKVMKDIYTETGVHPEQVTHDALQGDKGVWQDVLDGRIPDAYKDRVEQGVSQPTQNQRTEGLPPAPKAPEKPKVQTLPKSKPIYEMSREELDVAAEQAKAREEGAIEAAFGEDAAEVKKAVRTLERSNDDARIDAANDTLERLMAKHGISQAEADRILYGVGETEPSAEMYRDFSRELGQLDIDSPQALGASLARAITDVGEKTNPAEMTGKEQVAYAMIREAFDYARSQGWDLNEVSKAAIQVAAGRFSDPADAEFMLQRFLKPKKKGAEATPPPAALPEPPKTEAPKEEPKAAPAKPLTPEQVEQAKAFLDQPFAEVPQAPNEPSRPTHMNYNRIQTTEEAKQTLSRLSEIYEAKIREQQRSPRTWAKSHEDAAQVLADLLGSDPATVTKFLEGSKGDPSTTAQLLARKELALGFAEDLMRARAALAAKGDKATPEEIADFFAKAERASNVLSAFLGQRADVGRALNALKSTQREAEKAQAIIEAINSYGGADKAAKLVEMLGEYDNPAQVLQFANKVTKATTWEMVVEAWKAGLVSGFRTNEINFLSTAAFTTLRLPIEAITATVGLLHNAEERVMFSEIPARALGMMAGIRDGFKIAGAILRTGDNATGPKVDSFEPKIPGKVGEMVRLPFRTLAASDALLKAVNERGELYALAVRQAMTEGKTVGSPEFFGRVVDLVRNPSEEHQAASIDAGQRYTFTKPLGKGGQAFQKVIKLWHLEWMFPFITTPGNIFKETARMTPGMNLLVKEWREAAEKGGIERDRAIAEVTMGAIIMGTVMAAATNGTITGNGQPDKRMRATDRAAGWKPYALKINGAYYDGYLRMAPIGPLIGLTADAYEFWEYMTEGERDQWARMLAFAFASNVSNQTFMTGMTSFVNVMQDPSRYGPNYFESLAASVVPSIVGQTVTELDPLVREVHGMREAMLARLPWQRQGLMPQKDLFGEPIKSPERLWFGSPFSVSATSIDKVRTEASRLGFATPDIPKTIDVIPGAAFGKLDKVQLTPEQRDVFNTRSGQFAHDILTPLVAQPDWDGKSKMEQRMTFEKVFQKARTMAAKEALAAIAQEERDKAISAATKAVAK